jgi:hypothetical protein
VNKLSDVTIAAFVDELEKIAVAGGLSEEELGMLKEALLGGLLDPARKAISSGANALAGAAGRSGMGATSKLVGAFNSNIMTGEAGRGLASAGQHMADTASTGAMGGMRYGLGQSLQHTGKSLAGGGMGAVGKATWKMVNPIGTATEAGLTGTGHMASRAMNLSPTGLGHRVLTKGIPRAGELAAGAGASLAVGAPMGMAGLIGHHAMGALGSAAPAVADVAGHAAGALGEAGGEFAHHLGADALGTHGHGLLQKLRTKLPGAVRAA